MKCGFEKLVYDHIYKIRKAAIEPKPLRLLGIDSETFTDGTPFLCAISDGTRFHPDEFLEIIFSKRYRGVRFCCWNLHFDEGAFLSFLTLDQLNELREKGSVKYDNSTKYGKYTIHSIPGKELKFTKGHKSVCFYDILQFYKMSLDHAAQKFLGKNKIEIETRQFTSEYVKEHGLEIGDYCEKDAQLTAELAEYLINTLANEFDLYPQKLYSVGYISGSHFSKRCGIVNVKRFWNWYRYVLEAAYNSYSGGKFEVYKRGIGDLYQYDLNSAYPYEIANLRNTRKAVIEVTPEYQAAATYGFLDCEVLIHNDYSPLSQKHNGLNIYPIGNFRATITKAEYEYLMARGDQIDIKKAVWLYCPEEYPFRAEIKRLFKLKAKFKESDQMRYNLVKLLLNAFYGKFIQVTRKYKDDQPIWEAGYLFNPIYAAIITANTRIKLSRVCDQYPESIAAVHTDSIIATDPLDLSCSSGLGDWDMVTSGFGLIIGTGVYQIGDLVHYRGFKGKWNLIDLVFGKPRRATLEIPQLEVISWRSGAFRGKPETINRFIEKNKILDLNFDTKRLWGNRWNWKSEFTESHPLTSIDMV